ncbi:MAG: ABC transporter permease [Acidobacteria bacterium Pan2503]|uniref:ABC transporter permease n=1 Tax=Candidatus Acidiferrum panamense TaxID=2741543 RepID=A0A7V8NX33_9BACT|nr:ABC transporter permease [Candidatus Acidoferrum panamensis]
MNTLLQDLRYALRTLRKNLMMTSVIAVSLAIGIGANSAIFSVVDALLLRPLPYPEPDRLAAVWLHSPSLGILRDWPSPGEYIDIKKENHSFEQMALAQGRVFVLTGREQPERIFGARTQSSLLEMLGAKPLLGRLLLPEDDKPGKPDVAILTERVWRRLFNSDPAIVGKTIVLNGNPFIVAGVLQRSFMLNAEVMPTETPMDKMDILAPLPLGADAEKNRGDENYNIMVRLKPGVSVRQAQADLDVIASRIREKDKRDASFGMHVIGLQEQVVGDVRQALLVVLGSVGLVLLIACANVANLLLTRAASREKEVAIRTALGAAWPRLARQLLTESVLLALLGGGAGLLVAQLSLYVVRTMNPGNIPRLQDITINAAVLAFTLGVSVITGILFGVAPVWRAIKVDLNTSLKAGGRSGQSDGGLHLNRHSLRGLLVVSELTISLMLLIGAGLLIRSFVRLQNVPPGFTTDHVLTMEVAATGPKYRDKKPEVNFYKEVESRVAHLPGVVAEGTVSGLPLSGEVGWGGIDVEGYTPPPGQELQVDLRVASTDYFRTMEIPLRKGRFFNEDDTADKPQVVIIDEKFAERFWPGGDAIGKHVWRDPKKPFTIVGVVGVVKQYGLETDGKIAAYFPQAQRGGDRMFLAVRTSSEAARLSSAVVNQIHAIDPDVVVYGIRTMQDRLHDSLARQRFSSTMLGAFSAFALLLAAVGLYGVMSHLVSQGTHDIGVLVTLGAQPGNIIGLVVGQGMALAGIGVVLGLVGAAALTRVMASLLFGTSTTDAVTFAVVPVLLIIVALASTAIPAWRATSVDPMVALREE